ncbi:MAG: hypothetical protein GTO55_08045 [Armatimonadetes bacterium]|nr:hypothetical protein [Armatimonadota bacterium]NIM24204.1 hypothetical protein [Armatimonadota bacterium]NIM68073.1 hypothetical protein [Armatimonadota bacterium]NIM76535.1 hypothetical protein [Armatimonadota bacterium]NIN06278.1 hypothetical protein [Armatimonadota bacterium]
MVVARFCPTPSGELHHGNLYMAILNQEFARRYGGRFEVQIDDLFDRFPPSELIESIIEDLEWMEICPRERVLMHSRNEAAYLRMLDDLEAKGKAKIRRQQAGCCLAQVEIKQNGESIPVAAVRASSCCPGEVGYIPFSSDPRHLVAPNWISIIHEVGNWRHDTLWASDSQDEIPWIEFDLPSGSRPDTIWVKYWLPAPQETELLVRRSNGSWLSAAFASRGPQRVGEKRWAGYFPPIDDTAEVMRLSPTATAGGVDCMRVCFRGMQQTESYELSAPENGEIIFYHDLLLGGQRIGRTQPLEIGLCQFARSASDVILGTTHVIRGDELERELTLYVQCLHVLEYPLPVLCHIPHLVDEHGDKLSKSLNNAPRIAKDFRAKGFTPTQARRWVIENAYSTVKKPTPLHDFEAQLELLASTLTSRPVRVQSAGRGGQAGGPLRRTASRA